MGVNSTLASAAMAYALDGWRVFPLKPKGKNPLTRHGLYDGTANPETIRKWWESCPQANIGLPIPPGLLVLDLDSKDALQQLKALDHVLPATALARTGKGWHLWYRVRGKVRNRVGILPGVDIRAAGGYVVAPPSIHESGAAYRWREPLSRSSIPEAPEWLLALLEKEAPGASRSATDWAKAIGEPVRPGRRNQTLAEIAGLLFRRLPAEVAAEAAFCWAKVKLQPALPEREVLRTIDSIAACELRRRGERR